MENENMVEFEENENFEVEENDNNEKSGNGILGKVLAGVVLAAGAGIGAVLYKNREKMKQQKEQRDIAKLEKKGYRIFKAAEIVVDDEADVNDDETK